MCTGCSLPSRPIPSNPRKGPPDPRRWLGSSSGEWGSPQAEQSAVGEVDPTGAQITYWHQFTRFQQETLEANQWSIKVTAEFGGRYDDLYNKMVTAIAAGSVPDLVAAYQNEAAAYEASGALVDLNDYIDDPQWGLGRIQR